MSPLTLDPPKQPSPANLQINLLSSKNKLLPSKKKFKHQDLADDIYSHINENLSPKFKDFSQPTEDYKK